DAHRSGGRRLITKNPHHDGAHPGLHRCRAGRHDESAGGVRGWRHRRSGAEPGRERPGLQGHSRPRCSDGLRAARGGARRPPAGPVGEDVMSLDEGVEAPPVLEGEAPVVEPIVVEVAPPFRPSAIGWAARGLVMAAVAALVLLLPATKGNVDVHIYTQAVIYAIIGL